MRRTTRGRNVQHVEGHKGFIYLLGKDGKKYHKDDPAAPKKAKTVIVPKSKGRAIRHSPKVVQISAASNAKFIRWQDCEGAKRRGWLK